MTRYNITESSSIFDYHDSNTNDHISTITLLPEHDEDDNNGGNNSINMTMTSLNEFTSLQSHPDKHQQLHSTPLPHQTNLSPSTKEHYQCSKCLFQFDNLSHIIIHTKFCLDIPYYQCVKCTDILVNFNFISSHIHGHKSCSKICFICCEFFTNITGYNIHMNSHKLNLTSLEEDEDDDSDDETQRGGEAREISRSFMLSTIRSGIERCNTINSRISEVNSVAAKTNFICRNCHHVFTTRVRYNLHSLSCCSVDSSVDSYHEVVLESTFD